jgi:hypothetical protein
MERGKLAGIRKMPWQTDDAIGNKSWGYADSNTFKSAQYVITNLIDIKQKWQPLIEYWTKSRWNYHRRGNSCVAGNTNGLYKRRM